MRTFTFLILGFVLLPPAIADTSDPDAYLDKVAQAEVDQVRAESREYYKTQGLDSVVGQQGGLGYDQCLRACATASKSLDCATPGQGCDNGCASRCHAQYYGNIGGADNYRQIPTTGLTAPAGFQAVGTAQQGSTRYSLGPAYGSLVQKPRCGGGFDDNAPKNAGSSGGAASPDCSSLPPSGP